MILDRIIVNNFGVYGGLHTIDLTPPCREKPIILIGALNGAGKTTLLDALQLAFYGAHAQCASRGRLAYKDYLRAMIHRGVSESDGAAIEVHFRRFTEGKSRDMRVRRSWRDTGKGIEEIVEVQADGRYDPVISEHWLEYIESYLPLRLSDLFFFDGEQITAMAEDGRAAEVLSTAVHTLLGLDLVEKLQADLDLLQRRKLPKAASRDKQAQIEKLEVEVAEAERAEQAALDEKARLKTLFDRLRMKELPELRRRFQSEGGELYERRAEIEAAYDLARTELLEAEAALREMAAGPLPLLLVMTQLEEVEQQARQEIGLQHAQIVATAEEERDRQVLAALKRKRMDAALLRTVEETLAAHRPPRDLGLSTTYLHPDEGFADEVRRLREVSLPQAKQTALAWIEKCRLARERLVRLEEQLNAVPNHEVIERLQRNLTALEDQVRRAEAAFRLAEEKHRQLAVTRELKQRQLRNALEEAAEENENLEDDRRVLAHIPKVQRTLAEFKERVIAKHVATIERLVMESFIHLLHKKNLVSGLRVDPQTFGISLTGRDGKPLQVERLSAGERQLLATAILWGLAKASGRPMPTVIDTPLGRLDSSHRIHLVQRYFPSASHQVVLLSTDEEVHGRYLDMLQPYIGAVMTLVYDDALATTSIHKGFMSSHEATR